MIFRKCACQMVVKILTSLSGYYDASHLGSPFKPLLYQMWLRI